MATQVKTKKTQKKTQAKNNTWIWVTAIIAVVVLAALAWVFANQGNQPVLAANLPAEISVNQAYELYQDGTFLLDVRTQAEWDEYHAPGTTLIPLDQLASRVNELPADQPIVVVCRSGNRSQQGRDVLQQAGFENVTSMAGGLSAWRSAGYPVEP